VSEGDGQAFFARQTKKNKVARAYVDFSLATFTLRRAEIFWSKLFPNRVFHSFYSFMLILHHPGQKVSPGQKKKMHHVQVLDNSAFSGLLIFEQFDCAFL
jgi:hypothetical protein